MARWVLLIAMVNSHVLRTPSIEYAPIPRNSVKNGNSIVFETFEILRPPDEAWVSWEGELEFHGRESWQSHLTFKDSKQTNISGLTL